MVDVILSANLRFVLFLKHVLTKNILPCRKMMKHV